MVSAQTVVTEPVLADVVAVLKRTPGAIRALLDGLPDSWMKATEGEGTFGPREVIAHLVAGEKTDWIPRVHMILEAGEKETFVPFDRFGFREEIKTKSNRALLDEFEALRAANLGVLAGLALTQDKLLLKGRHPEFGPVTLGQLLATWAVHDLNHLGQTVRVMSKRYLEAVGPWKAYLGILKR